MIFQSMISESAKRSLAICIAILTVFILLRAQSVSAQQQEYMSATIFLDSLPDSLIVNQDHIPDHVAEYAWECYIDSDNNPATGDDDGFDVSFSIDHFVHPSSVPGTMPFATATQSNTWIVGPDGGTFGHEVTVEVDTDRNSITLSGLASWPELAGVDRTDRFCVKTFCWHAGGMSYDVTEDGVISVHDQTGDVQCSIIDVRLAILGEPEQTAVTIASFDAVPGSNVVNLMWQTGDESNNLGFNLYRSESKDGTYQKINKNIIYSKVGSGQGAAYTFTDTDVRNRKLYYYKLEDVDVSGTGFFHGPVRSRPRLIHLFVPGGTLSFLNSSQAFLGRDDNDLLLVKKGCNYNAEEERYECYEIVSIEPVLITVPDVTGMLQVDAEAALSLEGLTLGTVSDQNSDSIPAGTVISQVPAAGAQVSPGTPVDIVVSIGSAGSGLPPEPSTVAPPLDRTVPTNMLQAVSFLYTGTDAIQTGVSPGTIDEKRIAVLRGKVLDRNGDPLPGVTISVLNHAEFGQTLSRADGMFDLAVNGGGHLTVNYSKEEYLTAQRTVDVPWKDFTSLSDVVLVNLDSQTTVIDLSQTVDDFIVARGSVVTDSSGPRQATILFPRGVTAEIKLPDGSMQPVSSLTVRATEYTVGERGPLAMPAELPPTSAYTYCVELSADEAMALGAEKVIFSQPVYFYLENFIALPVGIPVPSGYYDKVRGTWVTSKSGIIINVVSITAGRADLDVDGDGLVDTGADLTDLGITDAELQQLAGLYAAGQTVWRVPIPHFTPWDCNYPPRTITDDMIPPRIKRRTKPRDDSPRDEEWGTIEELNQVFRESLPVSGTPFSLTYTSNRVAGQKANKTIEIPIKANGVLPDLIDRVELRITIAGQLHRRVYAPGEAPDRYVFEWDGKDAYGRYVQGAHPVSVTVSYVFPGWYQISDEFSGFGNGESIGMSSSRFEFSIRQKYRDVFVSFDARGFGLGGWSLDIHHFYDPATATLYRGDGSRNSAQTVNAVVNTVAGIGDPWDLTDPQFTEGMQATQAPLSQPQKVITAPDGSFYCIADGYYFGDNYEEGYYLLRVAPDGTVTTLAGPDTTINQAKWGVLLQILVSAVSPRDAGAAFALAELQDIVIGPDETLYVAKPGAVFKMEENGSLTRIAGKGEEDSGFSGDGGPAVDAEMGLFLAIAVSPSGDLFIADKDNCVIRRVGTNGIITSVTNPDQLCYYFDGEGGPAHEAVIPSPTDIAIARDGTLYIASEYGLYRIDTSGTVTTIMSGDTGNDYAEGIPAIDAVYYFDAKIAVAPDDILYVTYEETVRMITPDGIIRTVAGGATFGGYGAGAFDGEGGPPWQALFNYIDGLAVGPDNSLYIADTGNDRIRKIETVLPRFDLFNLVVPDGDILYEFDSVGRHLRTVSALTGAVLFEFNYDPSGYLAGITDGDGNQTIINRDAGGNPTALTAPFGQQTVLGLDALGYINKVQNPAGEQVSLVYSPTGLLTSVAFPEGNAYAFTYNERGRLIRADDPAGGFTELARTDADNAHEVSLTSAEGRTVTYLFENLQSGEKRLMMASPEGLQMETLIKQDGSREITMPDGQTVTAEFAPDPRFGMRSPILTKLVKTTPQGLTTVVTANRNIVLADPTDLLSLVSITDTTSINGKSFTSRYDASTRTITDTTPAGRQTSTQYDEQGRRISVTTPGSVPATYVYNAQGSLRFLTIGSGPDERTARFDYNAAGFVDTVTDPLGRTLSYEYDAAGRITGQTLPGSHVFMYDYDLNGNLSSILLPETQQHMFSYTPVQGIAEYTPPDVGIGDTSTLFAYNRDRQVTAITRSDGLTTNISYTAGGKPGLMETPEMDISYAYDPVTGYLASVLTSEGQAVLYTYDAGMLKEVEWQGPVTGSVKATYDNNLRQSSSTVNNGPSVGYSYDDDGLLTAAGALAITRDSVNGAVNGSTLGNVTDSFTYNDFGELTSFVAFYNASELFFEQHERDRLGRITSTTQRIGGTETTFDYSYDQAGRLTGVDRNGSPESSYTYDGNGNRLSMTGQGGTLYGLYDDQDRLVQYGSGSYSYTGNGELASRQEDGRTTTCHYDVLGSLRSVILPDGTLIEYMVDGMNRRIGKKINGMSVQGFLYQGFLNPVAELDASNAVVSRFVYGTKLNVPDYMIKDNTVYRIVSDHLGSPRLIVNVQSGEVVQRIDYDAFGNVLTDTNPGFQPFGYAGGIYDRDTGLVLFGMRDYDSVTGRWTAKDPINFRGGSAGLYTYVHNNPVNMIDPTGLKQGSYLDGLADMYSLCGDTKKAEEIRKIEEAYNRYGEWAEWDLKNSPPGTLPKDCIGNSKDLVKYIPYFAGGLDKFEVVRVGAGKTSSGVYSHFAATIIDKETNMQVAVLDPVQMSDIPLIGIPMPTGQKVALNFDQQYSPLGWDITRGWAYLPFGRGSGIVNE